MPEVCCLLNDSRYWRPLTCVPACANCPMRSLAREEVLGGNRQHTARDLSAQPSAVRRKVAELAAAFDARQASNRGVRETKTSPFRSSEACPQGVARIIRQQADHLHGGGRRARSEDYPRLAGMGPGRNALVS